MNCVSIIEELNARAAGSGTEDTQIARSAADLATHLISQAEAHLKQIIVQHPGFDLHDETHSAVVAKNMASLLGESGVKARSVFELFLLVTSAYLHDCAMAVPEWELNLFRMTEGVGPPKTGEVGVQNDLKPKITFDEARNLVQSRRENIFGNFETAKKWIFSTANEKSFIDDLAVRLREYQEFRNGFAEELRNLAGVPNKYQERSEQLRQDFIRQTHWLRIETWVRNLDALFDERLGGLWGKALAHDLAAICRSHGEEGGFVEKLPDNAVYLGAARSNLRLVALMLRLGDIIHFTPDRAPLMLFRQRLISSPISRRHWEVKNQGISYSIVDVPTADRTVRYSAYFQTPQLYFLFQEYLDAVDSELILYEELIGRVARSTPRDSNQGLPIFSLQVDRTSIRYDSERFQPVPGLRFSLDQRRILDLLMGVKLYKNRFACFRELYQNSLDACRCMLAAHEEGIAQGIIEFGIGVGETSEERYIYCRDNGIGMTKEIVLKYLLRIGNSFYRSSDFQRLVTSWKNPFTPTSQFGIGMLSCFMIGKRLEIISKPLAAISGTNEAICFMIDGPHENFYYKPPDIADVESIGAHGTLVKVFLTDSEKNILNDSAKIDIPLFQHVGEHLAPDNPLAAEAKVWSTHIYRHIASFVAECPPGARVHIRLSDGSVVELLRATAPFDYHGLGISRAKLELYENSKFRFSTEERNESYLNIVDHVIAKEITIEHEGVFFSCIINLPKPGFDASIRALAAVGALNTNHGVLIDGIDMGNSNPPHTMDIPESLARVGVLNFRGRHRPVLSVDRMSIVEWPKELEPLISPIAKLLAGELIREVDLHSSVHGFDATARESGFIWEYIFTRFGFLARELINLIVNQTTVTVPHRELSTIAEPAASIKKFADSESVTIHFSNYHALGQSTKLLLFAKLSEAKEIRVDDTGIVVSAGKFSPLTDCDDWDHFRERQYVFRSDLWQGANAAFDITSDIWPIVPPSLFDKLGHRYGECIEINDRTKCVHHFVNSLSAVSKLDPLLIHQRLGIYGLKRPSFFEKSPASKVYRFEEAQNNFWFNELGWEEWKKPASERKRYLLTAFIAPRPLTDQEVTDLERYKTEDTDYVKGIKGGWSILFLSKSDLNAICLPGKVSRRELINAVPDTFWSTHKETNFVFLDGEKP